ncbi:MAG: hypothetical protein ACXWUG_13230 [Polyangiales bacterium]
MRILLSVLLLGCASSETTPATAPTDSSTATDTVAVDTFVAETVTDSITDSGTDAACSLVKPYSTKDKPCNDCAAEKCCAEVNGCLGDKRCDDDYVNCILACALLPDDAGDAGGCISDCGTMYPAGKALYDTAIGCVEAACPTLCK